MPIDPRFADLEARTMETYRRLMEKYGEVPHIPRREPMHELISTMLSHRTTQKNEDLAYQAMWRRYGSWEAIQNAPMEELATTIEQAQFPGAKAANIKKALARINEERGEYSLDFLKDWPMEQALEWLMSMPGVGIKTVLPSEAHAKIVCRLVPNQDPAKVAEAIAAHVKRVTPRGVTVNVTRPGFTAEAYLMPADHWGNRATSEVLVEMYGREPYYVRTGGSIPVCTLFKKQLGAYTVNFAFGLDDERAHSPDEFFRLSSFRQGQDGYCVLLHRLAQETVPSK